MQCASRIARSLVFISVLAAPVVQERTCAEELSQKTVSELAGKLLEKRAVDGLSVGFIQGDRHGTYHFGKATSNGVRPSDLTVYEIGSASKLFTSLLVADAAVSKQIELTKPVDVKNKAKIAFPSREGRQISWLDLCVHRSGLPRLPSNLAAVSLVNPYRAYYAVNAAEFLASIGFHANQARSRSIQTSPFRYWAT